MFHRFTILLAHMPPRRDGRRRRITARTYNIYSILRCGQMLMLIFIFHTGDARHYNLRHYHRLDDDDWR